MAINLNLEIILDEEGMLLAYRNDHPVGMQGMVLNEGHWRVCNVENVSSDVLNEHRTLLAGVRHEICRN